MEPAAANDTGQSTKFPEAKTICFASEANELFFGVVGHVGSGTGFIANKLKELIGKREVDGKKEYEVDVIKAGDAIRIWGAKNGKEDVPVSSKDVRPTIQKTERMQTLGDEMRESTSDYAAVAQGVISLIRAKRSEWNGGGEPEDGKAVPPDRNRKRAYVIESIRHPAEVNLLRLVYGEAFALVGVVCHEDVREERLLTKYFGHVADENQKKERIKQIRDLMDRDSDDKEKKYGQHVADAFWESEYFVDNTPTDEDPKQFTLNEDLGRLVDIITHSKIVRPTIAETGMHIAVSAQIRSSCLSRQVGSSILDKEGNVLAIGSNEVPKAGGGVYGERLEEDKDMRCFNCEDPHCSSNEEQNELIKKLIKAFPNIRAEGDDDAKLIKKIRKVGLGSLLEFTRAIHAEMDALTTAARNGISVRGASMFVTAFPCHYCARHIVAAGISQVQYIEPYPKSRALSLHGDSITSQAADWLEPNPGQRIENEKSPKEDVESSPETRTVGNSKFGKDSNQQKVLFRPFIGVAPRLYHRAFTQDRKLKNDDTGKLDIGKPEWGGKWGIRAIPYTDLEARLTEEGQNG